MNPTLPTLPPLAPGEIRLGQTGRWTLLIVMDDRNVLARSEWGTAYEFPEKQWRELLLAPETK